MYEIAFIYFTREDVDHINESISRSSHYFPVFNILRAVFNNMDRRNFILVDARVSFHLEVRHHFKGRLKEFDFFYGSFFLLRFVA
jgi:hypothetical protein